jgi:HAE1 family hydrophobic/amphiphilic exporter-1
MAVMVCLLLGFIAFTEIPVDLMPEVNYPTLSVTTDYEGVGPEEIETLISRPLEQIVSAAPGVERVTSTSSEGRSSVRIEFVFGTDIEVAADEVRSRLDRGRRTLPDDIEPPTIFKFDVTQFPIMFLTVATDEMDPRELRMFTEKNILYRFERIKGVGQVRVGGGLRREIHIDLNLEKLRALDLSVAQVVNTVRDENLNRPVGPVKEGRFDVLLRTSGEFNNVNQLLDVALASRDGVPVYVRDIAEVDDSHPDIRHYVGVNGSQALRLIMFKQSGSNTVKVSDAIWEEIAEIHRDYPHIRIDKTMDTADFINAAIRNVEAAAGVGAVLAVFVLLLFLRSVSSTLIIGAAIPISVVSTFALMYFNGFTLNIVSFGGLALGVGMLVDNAIVVLENIYRRWEAGHSRREAIVEGARHMVLPIMAATMTTLIVYAPFLYFSGEQRIYYLPMAIMIALSVIGSVLVAFSFIPALVGKLLPRRDPDAPAGGLGGEAFYQRFYRNLLNRTLNWPWVTVVVPVLLLAGSYYVFDREVARGRIWGFGGSGESTYIDIYISLPRGSDIDRTDVLTQFFEERLQQMPEVKSFNTRVNPTSSQTRVTFPRELTHTDVPVRIKEQLFAYSLGFARAEVRVYGYGPSFYGGGGGGGGNYHIDILGYNYEKVREIAEVLGARLRRQARIRDVNTNADFRYGSDRATEFAVIINRDVAAQHGIPVNHLVGQINAAVQGQVSGSTIKMGGDEIRYDVKLEGYREVDLHELRKTLVLTPTGVPIRLGELISIEERNLLSTILREDQQYRRRVSYEFRGPYKLGNLVHESVIDATEVPPGYTVKKSEGYSWRTDDQREVWLVLGVALFLVFMVTSALFESLRQPLCVLLSVPMALIGVFLIFFYTGATFTREAYIGIIMMGGIVVNNAILLVDHINRVRRETALTLKQAILKGTMERVRPILMTTTTTIGALLPLVLLAPSVNANIWNALAYTLIGGLTASTFLVLTVTPALYLLFERHGGLIAAIILLLVVTPALYLVFTRVFEWSWPFASMSLLLIMVLSHALYVAFTRGRARGGGGEPAGGSEGSGGTAPA